MKTGIELIARARAKQLEKGWSLEHDQQHIMGELRQAASCFLETADYEDIFDAKEWIEHRKMWPFDTEFNPSSDRIENLAKAGALIAAEIDRLLAKKTEDKPRISEEFVGVAEPPSKTFPRVNEFICGSSYRR